MLRSNQHRKGSAADDLVSDIAAEERPAYELAEEAIAEWLKMHQRDIGRAAAEISRGAGK